MLPTPTILDWRWRNVFTGLPVLLATFAFVHQLTQGPAARKPPESSSPATASIAASTTLATSKARAKRKRFSKHDDLVLLRQVNADQPFSSARGILRDAWTALALKVEQVEGFSKQEIAGNSAQARFNVLLENHRDADRKSASASGVSENYTEVQQLPDEIALAVDEHAREEAKRTLESKEKLESEEKVGKMMREEAVSRLKKRKRREGEADTGEISPRKLTIYELMREDNEKERQLRAEQRKQKQEILQRQKEMEIRDRKEKREFKLHLARLENERYEKLLKLAVFKGAKR